MWNEFASRFEATVFLWHIQGGECIFPYRNRPLEPKFKMVWSHFEKVFIGHEKNKLNSLVLRSVSARSQKGLIAVSSAIPMGTMGKRQILLYAIPIGTMGKCQIRRLVCHFSCFFYHSLRPQESYQTDNTIHSACDGFRLGRAACLQLSHPLSF